MEFRYGLTLFQELRYRTHFMTTISPTAFAPAAAAPCPALPSSELTPLLGNSSAVVGLRHMMSRIAHTNPTVLLQGESGTGKEVVARQLGALTGGVFVKVNCAAIPGDLWESELFGYEPGAFTGANRQKLGKFELASGGTIFLDEISEMPLHLQAKLLQVLQDGEFARLGSHRSINVEVRVIAATNLDLRSAVSAGTFRHDLYYRLNVIAIHLPPLRERLEDVPLLTDYFLSRYAAHYHCRPAPLSPALLEHLQQHAWPGNVRELENLIKRYVILNDENAVLAELLPPRPRSAAAVAPAATGTAPASPGVNMADFGGGSHAASLLDIGRRAAQDAERTALLHALTVTHWNRRLAARQLQISYKSLQNKIKRLLGEASEN